MILSFDLLVEYPECNVLQEGQGEILSINHRRLVDDVNQNVRVLFVLLWVGHTVN